MRLLIVTLLITICAVAQDRPDDLKVLSYIEKVAARYNSDVQYDESAPVTVYESKFSKFPRKEVLVLFPVKSGSSESVIPVLYYYKSEKWTVCCSEDYTFISGAVVQDVEVIDFDNDGSSEVLYTVYSEVRGMKSTKYIMVSYEFGRKKKLYETTGFDAANADEGLKQLGIVQNQNRGELKEGDKLKVEVELELDDVNNDGINEIIKTDNVTVIVEKDTAGEVLSTRNFIEKSTYYYYNKRFRLEPPPPTKER